MDTFYDKFEEHLYIATRKVLDDLSLTTVNVHYANNDVLEPSKTYCVLNVIDIQEFGYTDEASWMKLDQNTLDFNTHYKACVQFSIIGTKARSVSTTLWHHITRNPVSVFTFQKNNLGFLNRSKIRKAPQLRESTWVDGFNFDIEMSFSVYTKQVHDWIEKIVVNDEIITLPPFDNE